VWREGRGLVCCSSCRRGSAGGHYERSSVAAFRPSRNSLKPGRLSCLPTLLGDVSSLARVHLMNDLRELSSASPSPKREKAPSGLAAQEAAVPSAPIQGYRYQGAARAVPTQPTTVNRCEGALGSSLSTSIPIAWSFGNRPDFIPSIQDGLSLNAPAKSPCFTGRTVPRVHAAMSPGLLALAPFPSPNLHTTEPHTPDGPTTNRAERPNQRPTTFIRGTNETDKSAESG